MFTWCFRAEVITTSDCNNFVGRLKLLPVQPGVSNNVLIQVFKQIPPTQQRIIHQGCELNEWMTLSYFCIQPSQALQSIWYLDSCMYGSLKTPALIALRYDDTLASVKIAIQEKEGIPAENQDLLFGELKLEDYHILKECGIRNECFLYRPSAHRR